MMTILSMCPEEMGEFSDTAFYIIWDDDHHSIYLYEDLRRNCPCAKCRDTKKSTSNKNSFKRTVLINIDISDMRPNRFEAVGNYAIRFFWKDGHSTGIYTFEFLRNFCTCNECDQKEI